jgi:hypothetical protein
VASAKRCGPNDSTLPAVRNPAAAQEAICAVRRALRLPLFSASTVALGACAHVYAGGRPPSLAMQTFLVAAVWVVWAAVCPRERSFPVVLAVVGLTQGGIHLALAGDCAGPTAASPCSPALMLASHVLAGLLLALWLHRRELAVWRDVRQLFSGPAASTYLDITPLWRHVEARVVAPVKAAPHLERARRRGPPAFA